MLAVSVWEKSRSPVHLNVSVPLSVATVWKVMNGLAAIEGCSEAWKTTSSLWRLEHGDDIARDPRAHRVMTEPGFHDVRISVLIVMISPRLALAGT